MIDMNTAEITIFNTKILWFFFSLSISAISLDRKNLVSYMHHIVWPYCISWRRELMVGMPTKINLTFMNNFVTKAYKYNFHMMLPYELLHAFWNPGRI